jgi:hypothetical protein
MAGSYYVLEAESGRPVKKIETGDPILSAPAVGGGRVYFATLGSRVYALTADGETCWVWDFVGQRLDFSGDRWSGQDWLRIRGRAGWREQFCCTRDVALIGKTVVSLPAAQSAGWKTRATGPTCAQPTAARGANRRPHSA